MRLYSLFIVLATLFTLVVTEVIELTDSNFGELVGPQDEWVIKFYADWCGYCKGLEPKFQAAERIMDAYPKDVHFGSVNIEQNPGLGARFFVSRLPTLVHIKDHQVRVMEINRNQDAIVYYITEELWRNDSPKSGLISPFSLFGKMIGMTGVIIKKLSNYSPWTMIGVLTSFLIVAITLPMLLAKPTEAVPQEEEKKEKPKARKTKRID
ncbi:thioredoxin-like protein [Backusella circina FSU 941]|nr:thioredoxin-like protein [Backusella circina FSU 941]